jgi:hypothetical protein
MLLNDESLDRQYIKLFSLVSEEYKKVNGPILDDGDRLVTRISHLLDLLFMYKTVAFYRTNGKDVSTSLSIHILDLIRTLVGELPNGTTPRLSTMLQTLSTGELSLELHSFAKWEESGSAQVREEQLVALIHGLLLRWNWLMDIVVNKRTQSYQLRTNTEQNPLWRVLVNRGSILFLLLRHDGFLQVADLLLSILVEGFRLRDDECSIELDFMLSLLMHGLFNCMVKEDLSMTNRRFLYAPDEVTHGIQWDVAFKARRPVKTFTFPLQEMVYSHGCAWYLAFYQKFAWHDRVIDLMIEKESLYNIDYRLELFEQVCPGLYSLFLEKETYEDFVQLGLSSGKDHDVQAIHYNLMDRYKITEPLVLSFFDAVRIGLLNEWFNVKYQYNRWLSDFVIRPIMTPDEKTNYKLVRHSLLPAKTDSPSLPFLCEIFPGMWGVLFRKDIFLARNLDHAIAHWLSILSNTFSNRLFRLDLNQYINIIDEVGRFEPVIEPSVPMETCTNSSNNKNKSDTDPRDDADDSGSSINRDMIW